MKKFYILLFMFAVLVAAQTAAQNIKSEDITYAYYRLPLQPLGKSIHNYQVTIEAPFEAKNKQLQKEYEQQKKEAEEQYNKEMAQYAIDLKEAESDYAKEKEAYDKKSVGTKWVEKKILEENTKPVKQLPAKPYPPNVPKPLMQSMYDYTLLGNTYINLEGFERKAGNALKILVTLYGFDYSQPRVLGEQAATGAGTYYHTEFSYRHPMAVKVSMPDDKEMLNVTPPALNIYKNYKTPASAGMQQVNSEALIKSSEEKVLQDNLFFINDLLNNRYCFSKVKKTTRLYYIKNKQDEYGDLTNAFNEASAGLPMLELDSSAAKVKLQKAIALWNAALKESDIANKKARIDKDVTIAICFNLLETCFATANADAAKVILDKLNTMNLPSDERTIKNDYELLFSDLKTRQQNNK